MRLVIAGGGTGGHLFPGIAIAEAVMANDPRAEVLFVGTERGIESRAVPKAGFRLALIEVAGLKGASLDKRLGTVAKLPMAGLASRRILKDFGADAVIGVGGYASGPVLVAATLMGLPTAICEQNSVPGVTNRILSRLVRKVYVTFKASLPHFSAEKAVLVGNPVRRSFQVAARAATNNDDVRVPGRIFIFGGSQGARPLNEVMPEAMALLRAQGHSISVVHQAGKDAVDGVKAAYDDKGVTAEVTSFIDDMVSQYRAADVVICRAGATSCAEVTALGVAAILIPFPQAADDHQTMNAQDLVDQGAALMLRQQELSGASLAAMVHDLLSAPDKLAELRRQSAAAGRLDAADVVADAARDGFRGTPRAQSAEATA